MTEEEMNQACSTAYKALTGKGRKNASYILGALVANQAREEMKKASNYFDDVHGVLKDILEEVEIISKALIKIEEYKGGENGDS